MLKKACRLIATILVVSLVIIAGNLLLEGIPLWGTPHPEQVVRVVVTHGDYPDEIQEYTDEEHIELAAALFGYLRYSPLKGLTDDGQLIQLTFVTADGTEYAVSANHATVWWNGTARALQDEGTFVKMCTAVFFGTDSQ